MTYRLDIGNDWISNPYYDEAEKYLNLFWDEKTIFHKYFSELDCTNIVELAVGHGRHVQKYLEKAKTITLVDINRENIDFCQKRYSRENKIKYLVNSGNDFNGIDSNSQTAIFCYDAMVHFELVDILEYLKESNRILVNGGKILFHHSNAAFSPELLYNQKPGGRNFLSADIFTYLATRNDFEVLRQDIFPWGNSETQIDCLSLCQKGRREITENLLQNILQQYDGKYILFGQQNAENYIKKIKSIGFDLPLEIWDNKVYGSKICGVPIVKPSKGLDDKTAIICTVKMKVTYDHIVEQLPDSLKSQTYFGLFPGRFG